MDTKLNETTLQKIKSALLAGRKIEAARLYHGAMHVGLAEAKSAADRIEKELRATSPEKFTAHQAPWGVSLALMISLFTVGYLALMALWSSHTSDLTAERRYSDAASVAMLVMITLYGCIFSYSTTRGLLGYLGLSVALFLMAAKILHALGN